MAEVRDSLLATIVLGMVLLLFLFLGCGIMVLLFYPENGAGGGTGGQANGTNGTANGTVTPQNTTLSQEDLALWDNITKQNVEQACLRIAKDEAGPDADKVYSCGCEESAGSERKVYICDIDTADPLTAYFVNLDCLLGQRACAVESNYGTTTVTFGELRAWYEG
ncbi:hypothetical protein H0O00_02030 [Candidatus Micrarchaeota archaeon]|nr:hypothetical protein [Candidatus Micrarchaeota archaeon]